MRKRKNGAEPEEWKTESHSDGARKSRGMSREDRKMKVTARKVKNETGKGRRDVGDSLRDGCHGNKIKWRIQKGAIQWKRADKLLRMREVNLGTEA